jgi:hypothetical protein
MLATEKSLADSSRRCALYKITTSFLLPRSHGSYLALPLCYLLAAFVMKFLIEEALTSAYTPG